MVFFGPKLPLPAPIAATGKILKKFIDGSMSFGGPKISYGIVDVRDVAKIHIQAMKLADTDGKRFILTSSDSEFTILETATILTEILPKEMSAKLPTRELPTLVLKVLGYFLSQIRHMLPTIRPKKLYNANRAKVVFEWTPTDPKTSLYDACMTIGT